MLKISEKNIVSVSESGIETVVCKISKNGRLNKDSFASLMTFCNMSESESKVYDTIKTVSTLVSMLNITLSKVETVKKSVSKTTRKSTVKSLASLMQAITNTVIDSDDFSVEFSAIVSGILKQGLSWKKSNNYSIKKNDKDKSDTRKLELYGKNLEFLNGLKADVIVQQLNDNLKNLSEFIETNSEFIQTDFEQILSSNISGLKTDIRELNQKMKTESQTDTKQKVEAETK